eukprot:16381_5
MKHRMLFPPSLPRLPVKWTKQTLMQDTLGNKGKIRSELRQRRKLSNRKNQIVGLKFI